MGDANSVDILKESKVLNREVGVLQTEIKGLKEWVDAKMESLKKDVGETKKIALSTRKKADVPHSCLHEADFKSLITAVSTWRNIKLGAFLTFIIICAGVLTQYYAFDSKVAHALELGDENSETNEANTKIIEEVTQTVEKVAKSLEDHIIWAEQKQIEDRDGDARTLRITVETIEHAIKKSMNKQKRR